MWFISTWKCFLVCRLVISLPLMPNPEYLTKKGLVGTDDSGTVASVGLMGSATKFTHVCLSLSPKMKKQLLFMANSKAFASINWGSNKKEEDAEEERWLFLQGGMRGDESATCASEDILLNGNKSFGKMTFQTEQHSGFPSERSH